ncbi:MAG: hypothetical protein FWH37_02705 [Candidatus Bathyarchaeota archaeon]|nr:hypothetical protein [Candidatus Termiticorpusculum sp.]
MSNQNANSKVTKNRLHVLGIDAEIDPAIGKKLKVVSMVRIVFILGLWGFPDVAKHDFYSP